MRPLPTLLALALAAAITSPSAFAMDCAFSRVETPDVDLAGVERVEVTIGSDRIALTPTTGAAAPALSIRHCASSEDLLANSVMRVDRRGDTLVIKAEGLSVQVFNLFGKDRYTWREIALALPAGRTVALDVGSGDASVSGMGDIAVNVGSGDVHLSAVGAVQADVGSGDLVVDGARDARFAVGSGDATLRTVAGAVRGSVGSGDAALEDVAAINALSAGSGDIVARRVRGDVRGLDVGSGTIAIDEVDGSVVVEDVGSGDVRLRGVRGSVNVGTIGSGDVDLDGVGGDVIVRDEDTLESVRRHEVAGRTIIGA